MALVGSRTPGRIAQLEERQLDTLEVTGSSPVAPIPGAGPPPMFHNGKHFAPASSG